MYSREEPRFKSLNDYDVNNIVINYLIAAFVVAALVYLAILQFWVLLRTKKHLTEMKSAYSEINDQREELQVKNKDITDSLNYARRIQAALLPAESLHKTHFSQIFYLLQAQAHSQWRLLLGEPAQWEILHCSCRLHRARCSRCTHVNDRT